MRGYLYALCLLLVGCGGTGATDADGAVPPAIASRDFAVQTCGAFDAYRPCAKVKAGGKFLLLGTPAGAGYALSEAELRSLDAVFLFSLSARDVEGLDEVRNLTWAAGRTEPLKVSGPDGTAAFIAALNTAFQTSDALVYIDAKPAGGFDSALLSRGRDVRPIGGQSLSGDAPVKLQPAMFDSGDLKVSGVFWTARRVALLVQYEDKPQVLFIPCGERDGDTLTLSGFDAQPERSVSCNGQQGDMAWPLTGTEFIFKAE